MALERVAPSGLVPQELLDEAYQFLLYQANGLSGGFKGTDNGKRPPSFRVHARTPKVVRVCHWACAVRCVRRLTSHGM